MIDNKIASEISRGFEDKIGGIFKKYNLKCQKLDNDSTGRRPDYFVTKDQRSFICECKYIASAGMTSDRKHHISTLDPELYQSGVFNPDISKKLTEVLNSAKYQFKQLIKDKPKYKNLPFIVAIGSDFYSDNFDLFVPSDMFGIHEISALIKLERNVELNNWIRRFNLEAIIKIIDKKIKVKYPPESSRFKVIHNSKTKNKFNSSYFLKNSFIRQNH